MQKRKPRRVVSPLMLLAGKQAIGNDADRILFPFAVHLEEVAKGHGYGQSIRVLTMFAAATYDAGLFYGHKSLLALADKAGDDWIVAGETTQQRGITDRIVMTADSLKAMRALFCALLELMPSMELAAWTSFMGNAQRRWDKFAASQQSVFRYAAAA